MKLIQQFNQIDAYIQAGEKRSEAISDEGIFWQLDHILKVIVEVVNDLEKPSQEKYKPKYNLARFYILTTGHIPRGAGRAPKSVISENEITLEELRLLFDTAKEALVRLENFPKNLHFHHPYFGDHKTKKTIRFLGIHTHHHLKIVRDISNA